MNAIIFELFRYIVKQMTILNKILVESLAALYNIAPSKFRCKRCFPMLVFRMFSQIS
jgi:hypothetical protein